MSINNIPLSTELLAMLYPDSLVLEREPERPGKAAETGRSGLKPAQAEDSGTMARPAAAYRFLGNYQRRICFLVSCPESVFLPDDQLDFLSKMLAACRCSIADIAVLNLARTPGDIQELTSRLNPEMLFLCGVSPDLPGADELPSDLFRIGTYRGISVIRIPALGEINRPDEAGTTLKKQLWASLKKLFNL